LLDAKQEFSDVAGIDAALELAKTHATCNKRHSTTRKHYNKAMMEFLEQSKLLRVQAKTKVVRPDNKLCS